jgi:hypothetical protein
MIERSEVCFLWRDKGVREEKREETYAAVAKPHRKSLGRTAVDILSFAY